jgi:hypothetical protein
MQLSLPLGRRTQATEDPRDAKLHAVLLAARKTAFYGRKLKSFGKPGSAEPAAPSRDVLSGLPPVTARMFLENREQFTKARSRALQMAARVHVLPSGWRAKLGFSTEQVEGPQQEIARLAAAIEAGDAEPDAGARRLIVYGALGDALLSPELRERLWEVFELPVFEQLRGWEGEVFASECDAHDGLHLDHAAAIFEVLDGELVVTSLLAMQSPVLRLCTGMEGAIQDGACPCGETVARFMPAAVAAPVRKAPSLEHALRRAEHRFASAG